MALIHEKILEVQKNVPTLEKNGIGPQTQGSYKFLSVDDVLHGVKPLLNDAGIVTVPNLLDHGFHYNSAIAKDNERVPRESIHAWVKYDFEFVAAEDGSSIHAIVVGEGIDTQDKALRKATTSAWKIALIQAFQLATGEIDPDAQDGAYAAQEAAPSSSPAQAKIAKAQGGGQVTRKSTGSPTTAGEYRTAILAAVKSGGGIADYEKVGNRISGKQKSEWLNDVEVLSGVLKALEAGEVE
jgi:hypothetical protein